MKNSKRIYPFTAIVGQENMKKALILNIINPSLGGVLIKGEKGTAKSTAVRALAEILPERSVVKDCIFGCNPYETSNMCYECVKRIDEGEKLEISKSKMKVINLPVSATEDRVVGTLDIEHAIKTGEKKFEHGLLASANRNILYIDEINLLDDHVVDVILDSAAMGVNTIEREGISFSHPSNFVLVGTMNPEEGDLRPQLLDRFGLVVEVKGEEALEDRVEVIKRRLEYEKDSEAFYNSYIEKQNILRERIINAQKALNKVTYDDEILETAAKISIALQVDGHRADISVIKTAQTIAAFEGNDKILKSHMLQAAALALPHRMRRRPFQEGKIELSIVEDIIKRK